MRNIALVRCGFPTSDQRSRRHGTQVGPTHPCYVVRPSSSWLSERICIMTFIHHTARCLSICLNVWPNFRPVTSKTKQPLKRGVKFWQFSIGFSSQTQGCKLLKFLVRNCMKLNPTTLPPCTGLLWILNLGLCQCLSANINKKIGRWCAENSGWLLIV